MTFISSVLPFVVVITPVKTLPAASQTKFRRHVMPYRRIIILDASWITTGGGYRS